MTNAPKEDQFIKVHTAIACPSVAHLHKIHVKVNEKQMTADQATYQLPHYNLQLVSCRSMALRN